MYEPDLQRCKCGAAFYYYPTAGGKVMPIDVEPNARGNVIIEGGVAVVLKKGDPRWQDLPKSRLRISHFATCHFSAHYRKKR